VPAAEEPFAHGTGKLRPDDLVAVALPPGPAWIPLLERAWEREAAVLPVDPRLSGAERDELIRRARPTVLVDHRGWRRARGEPAAGAALVMHTSGTAGAPKLVELERHAVESAVRSSFAALGASVRDRSLCCLPAAHVGGLLVILRKVVLGAPVAIHPGFDPAAAGAEGADLVSIVPAMLARLLDAGLDLRRFRSLLVGGSALREDLRARGEAAGARLVESYGLTETCGGVFHDGRPLPGTEARIAAGGIELRGPTLMRGYRGDPAGTALAFADGGWLRTGDAGWLDPEGRLHVSGRLDEMIDSGGEKVWPQEVEAALATHRRVADVAVAGRADDRWGRRVVAFVVPRDGADPPTLPELRDHASSTIARFKAPRELVLVRALPRTASGKLRRGALSRLGERGSGTAPPATAAPE
jgi:O-succinylbenzoic acid--CoA ligase